MYELSWKCDVATKEFLKADVLSISPFPEQIGELCLGLGMVYIQKDEAMPIVETCIPESYWHDGYWAGYTLNLLCASPCLRVIK